MVAPVNYKRLTPNPRILVCGSARRRRPVRNPPRCRAEQAGEAGVATWTAEGERKMSVESAMAKRAAPALEGGDTEPVPEAAIARSRG